MSPAQYASEIREHNREVLYIWLTYYAGGYNALAKRQSKTDAPKDKVKKRGGKIPGDLLWLDALSDPDVARSNAILRGVILRELPSVALRKRQKKKVGEMCREHLVIFERVYLEESSDPGLPERWRMLSEDRWQSKTIRATSKSLLEMHDEAIEWVLDEIEARGEVLEIPEPDEARDWVEDNAIRRRIARSVFFKQIKRGVRVTQARRVASRVSGRSFAQVRRDTAKGIPNGPPDTGSGYGV